MKLWKSKKPTSCVPGKSSSSSGSSSGKNEEKDKLDRTGSNTTVSGSVTGSSAIDRAMSPAQSEDSGLAADRGTTYATISIPRENAQAMGIIFTERSDLSYPPVIESINVLGPAADFLAPGDRIHQVDGISTIGLANQHIFSILCHGEGPAVIEIEYSLPEYISQNSLCVVSKLAQITVERENGCLGLTLRGGGEYPLIVTNVRPAGPVYKTGRIKPGDRVLRVDNISLVNKTLSEAQQILKCGHISGYTNLTIEYDVSVMQSVEFSLGPLLIEIERPMNEKLGLILSNYSSAQHLINDHNKMDEVQSAGVYIASILPASIADRCGALSVGDQILSIDETIIENTSYSPEDVASLLDGHTTRGFTQLQILPANAMIRRRGLHCGSPKYNYNTLDSKKAIGRQKKFIRKSSMDGGTGGTLHPNIGLCRSETEQIVLDCSQGSGICLGPQTPCGRGYIIAQILPDSVAERSGCIQKGDRILSVNKLYNLDPNTIRQILGDYGTNGINGGGGSNNTISHQGTHWVELDIEFDMADSVIPSSGVFNVKLVKHNKNGLGITVNGSSHGSFVISEVKPGSPAHRTGSLRPGDILLAVDSHPIQHYNVDLLLKENKNEFITLTVKRNSLPDFLFDAQQRTNGLYGSSDENTFGYAKYRDNKYSDSPQPILKTCNNQTPDYFQIDTQIRRPFWNKNYEVPKAHTHSLTTEITEDPYGEIVHYNIDYSQRLAALNINGNGSNGYSNSQTQADLNNQLVFNVRLEPNGGPLGLTLSGSEDLQKPILLSGLNEGGIAANSEQLRIGDCLLAINGESVVGMPLSTATKLLQQSNQIIDLQLSRLDDHQNLENEMPMNLPQAQAIYAKVQRRPRSPSVTDVISTSSRDSQTRTIHVTLFKDRVYDDYGFSVSDGLYERGVYINRIRTGGPADMVGLLKPFDRIVQVNGTKTQDFDCCLTVPLIAAAGDKIEMIVQRTLSE